VRYRRKDDVSVVNGNGKIGVLPPSGFNVQMDAAKEFIRRETNFWVEFFGQWVDCSRFLRDNHPRLDAAVRAKFVRVDAAPLAFLARPNLALLLRRDIVVSTVNKMVSVCDAHHDTIPAAFSASVREPRISARVISVRE